MTPENDYALGPLDVFPADIAASANRRNLLFSGWWSWLEKWGKLVSIFLGVYYLYVVGRWLLTTLFLLRVLYQEHGFGLNLLWGLGPGQDVFPVRFYRRWRRFKQHFSRPEDEPIRAPRPSVPHKNLAIAEDEVPPLPQCNRAVSNVYLSLPTSKSSIYSNGPRAATYAAHERQTTPVAPAPEIDWNVPKHVSISLTDAKPEATPPAADARSAPMTSAATPPSAAPGLVGLPPP